jgi:hypothetical protein
MSNILQITSRLWQLQMGMVNSFLLKTNDGLLLRFPGLSFHLSSDHLMDKAVTPNTNATLAARAV